MRYFVFIILFFQLSLPACRRKNSFIMTCELKRSDYYEAIDATGTIQAVTNLNLVTPALDVSGISVRHLVAEGTIVKKGDIVCILDAPELNLFFEQFNNELATMEAELKKLEADNAMELSMLNAQVETNGAQLAISMLDSIQIKFATPVKQKLLSLEMEKAIIEKKKLQKKLAAFKIINNSEVVQMNSRILMQKNQIQMYQNQIKSLTLTAPDDGIVLHCESPEIWFLGNGVGSMGGKIEEKSKVWSNMPLLQFPDMKEMQVSVEVPESDYKRIKEGQKALISVDATSNLKTTGKIKRKTLAGSRTQENAKVKKYEVIISVDSCHSQMKPGLSATCRIIIDEVKDTVVVPAAAIFSIDSSKIVYVAKDNKFIPVTIETGLSNSSSALVTKGLEGTETIALTEPPHYLTVKRAEHVTTEKDKSIANPSDTIVNDSSTKK
jgi:HlyD family secretion protein